MYKIKIEDSNEQKIEIPEIPFIITHCERKSHYIVSKNSGDKYLLTAIDNGITYDNDNDYVEKFVYDSLNNGTWLLRKSKIVII